MGGCELSRLIEPPSLEEAIAIINSPKALAVYAMRGRNCRQYKKLLKSPEISGILEKLSVQGVYINLELEKFEQIHKEIGFRLIGYPTTTAYSNGISLGSVIGLPKTDYLVPKILYWFDRPKLAREK